jgi:hypothetical protein
MMDGKDKDGRRMGVRTAAPSKIQDMKAGHSNDLYLTKHK